MNEDIILELLKIIKDSKLEIIKLFDEEIKELEICSFENFTELVLDYSMDLGNTLMQESSAFVVGYDDKEFMIKELKKSFINIKKSLSNLLDLYKKIKSSTFKKEVEKEIYLKVVEKVLNDYMLWCEKLENAILGVGKSDIVFAPNVEVENKIASYIIKNEISKNYVFPFLVGAGFGYLMDEWYGSNFKI